MSTLRGHLSTLFALLVLSTLWTWPAANLIDPVLPTRHFDLLPTIWLIDVAPEVLPGLVHPDSVYPAGEHLARLDSYLLLGLGWLLQGALPALVVARLLIWLGPALSAFAAERCAARAFGVERPWSLVAGVSYGFSGVMASAILEGQAYSLLNPWLPLLLWASWVGLSPGGRARHGLAAGLAWGAAHLTSAYFGFLGLALLGGLTARALWADRAPRRVLVFGAGLASTALPAGLLQLHLFRQGSSTAGFNAGVRELMQGSVSLAELLGWAESVDIAGHSVNAPLQLGVLALALMAPVVLGARAPWRALLIGAGLALFAAMGPILQLHPASEAQLTSPFAWLLTLPGVAFFRFPYRFTWLYSLLVGVLAALVLQALSSRLSRRWTFWVLPLVLVDVLGVVGLPWRTRDAIAEAPSAYLAAPEGWAVLDLFAGRVGVSVLGQTESAGDAALWARNLSCYYQVSHQRPIPTRCISTDFSDPRTLLQDALFARLMDYAERVDTAAIGEVEPWLLARGVGAVALHVDFLRPQDRALLHEALSAALGPPTADTDDGGERLQLWVVRGARDAAPPDRGSVLTEEAPHVTRPASGPAPGPKPTGAPAGPPPGQIPPRSAPPSGPPPSGPPAGGAPR
ncbi:MAG: hypothetical protein H6741_06230 [Alphaproteobacteria bacterium]|nr:hypothetical protein [Alphaproteobacteria bacterium]MCB9792307.1 hypothetical protein [Alphaproteobacteria bacterium]